MTRSRVVLIVWIALTLLTMGLYARAVVGTTYVYVGGLQMTLTHSFSLEARNSRATSPKIIFEKHLNHERGASTEPILRWDRLSWGKFFVPSPDGRYPLVFPIWWPYFIFSAVLYALFAHSRDREKHLRSRKGAQSG